MKRPSFFSRIVENLPAALFVCISAFLVLASGNFACFDGPGEVESDGPGITRDARSVDRQVLTEDGQIDSMAEEDQFVDMPSTGY
jgi:hypothetical protein